MLEVARYVDAQLRWGGTRYAIIGATAMSLHGTPRSTHDIDLLVGHTRDAWPKELTQLSGAWADFPSLDDIRSGQGEDGERETL